MSKKPNYELSVSIDNVSLLPCVDEQTKVDPGKDSIYVNGNRLPKKLPPKVYLALNKPKGFVFYLAHKVLCSNLNFVKCLELIRLILYRYICSSGEKETKPVISLFDDFLKSWVCATGPLNIYSSCGKIASCLFNVGCISLPWN